MPARPFELAAFLSDSAKANQTEEPTKKRVAAINLFHSLGGYSPPSEHPFVRNLVQGIRNRLGRVSRPRDPISLQQIYDARERSAANNNTGLTFVADICSVMQEAQLRWDDIADMRLGDIMWTDTAVRLLVVDGKTDSQRQGRFATLAFSMAPHSASQRLLHLIRSGVQGFARLPKATQTRLLTDLRRQQASLPFRDSTISGIASLPADITEAAAAVGLPLENLPLLGNWPWQDRPDSLLRSLSYNCFRCHLRKLFEGQPHIGTHSLRRGGTDEKISGGMDARLVQWLGGWKRTESFEGYVRPQTNMALAVEAMERTRAATMEAAGASKLSPCTTNSASALSSQALIFVHIRFAVCLILPLGLALWLFPQLSGFCVFIQPCFLLFRRRWWWGGWWLRVCHVL
jgi:hypothetical protein